MKKRLSTFGYLIGHWGIGIGLGALAPSKISGLIIGIICVVVGSILINATKTDYRK